MTEFFDFRTSGCCIVQITLYNGTRLYLNTEFATFLDRVPLFRWMTLGHPAMAAKRIDVVDGFVYLDYKDIFDHLSVHSFDIVMSCVLGRRPVQDDYFLEQVQQAAESIGAYDVLSWEFQKAWEMKQHRLARSFHGPAVVPFDDDSTTTEAASDEEVEAAAAGSVD